MELAQYREMEAFSQFSADLDLATQKLLARGERLTELLKQAQYSHSAVEEQILGLFAGINGHLDALAIKDVKRFEETLHEHTKFNNAILLERIKTEQKISDDIAKELHKVLSDFAKSFV